jgi:glucose/arabinose dehydrogenase
MRLALAVSLGVLALGLAAPAAGGVRLKRIAGGFAMPVQVTAPRSDPGRMLYVVEQEGRVIRRLPDGSRNVFLNIRDLVLCCGERGMLSLAFHWDYANTRWIYVLYVNNGGDIVVARYRANVSGTRVVESTRKRLVRVEHSARANHNGGTLAFGPDRRLYVSIGDGGGSCDPGDNAQDLSTLLGKVASRDVDPPMGNWRIEAYGLRNPWRFSFDRRRGHLWIGDVGQSTWEEINRRRVGRAGGTKENYGWNEFEGFASIGCDGGDGLEGPSGHSRPIAVYSHSVGCSITGGHVYRGSGIGGLYGWYVYGDYCSGRIWRLRVTSDGVKRRLMFDTSLNISSFGEDPRGENYVVHHGGSIYRLVRS